MTDEQSARFQAAVDQAAASLGEHFDAVQIVAVVTDPDGTPEEVMVAGGSGSFYARWAATRELVLRWDTYTKEHAKGIANGPGESEPDEPDDGFETAESG